LLLFVSVSFLDNLIFVLLRWLMRSLANYTVIMFCHICEQLIFFFLVWIDRQTDRQTFLKFMYSQNRLNTVDRQTDRQTDR